MRRIRGMPSRATTLALIITVVVMGLSGCAGRRQALLTSQRLAWTSEQAIASVAQAKTNSLIATQAHREVRQAYRQLSENTWRTLLENQQRLLEVVCHQTLAELEIERTRCLQEHQQQRSRLQAAVDARLHQALADLDSSERNAETRALEARKQSQEAPGDLPLLQKSLEADVVYFALAAQSRELELAARARVQDEFDNLETVFHERLQNVTQRHRADILAAFSSAKNKLAGTGVPAPELGPEPESNPVFYDSLERYLGSVQQAAKGLQDYLESSGFGSRSLLVDYLRSTGGALLSGVVQPAASPGEDFAALRQSAKDLGQDYLSDLRAAGSEATDALSREARNLGERVSEDLLTRISRIVTEGVLGVDR